MFTGIIRNKGKVKKIKKEPLSLVVSIEAPLKMKFKKGESISVSGVCSTVVKTSKNIFEVFYMEETLRKSWFRNLNIGQELNLEKSLKIGDPLDGYFVSGHIDTTALLINKKNEGESVVLRFKIEKEFKKYLILKGGIVVDGVSLTISSCGKDFFEVSLIPFTLNETTLSFLNKGSVVNVEFDMITKIVLSGK